MFKPSSSLTARCWTSSRTYATRRPEKPPARFPDPLRNHPKAVVTPLEGGKLTFIRRPPPSAPSPYSTTLDPTSPLLRPPTATTTSTGGSNAPQAQPPLLRPSAYRPDPERLSKEDVEKLRALRRSQPEVYTCGKLAKMFDCTPSFVSQVAALPRTLRRAYGKREDARVEGVKARWGERKATARAIREKRREFW